MISGILDFESSTCVKGVRHRKHYEIRWTGLIIGTLDALNSAGANVYPGRPPRGGKHVRTREEGEKLLGGFLERCGVHAPAVIAAHRPRVVEIEHGRDELD